MNSGAANPIAVASVSGNSEAAEKPQNIPVSPTAERARWPSGRRVRSTLRPVVGRM